MRLEAEIKRLPEPDSDIFVCPVAEIWLMVKSPSVPINNDTSSANVKLPLDFVSPVSLRKKRSLIAALVISVVSLSANDSELVVKLFAANSDTVKSGNLFALRVPELILLASVVSVVAELAKDVPLRVIASASSVPSTSTSPLISKLLASISPLDLNITLSPPATSNIIWLSVLNLIRLSSSLPITRLAFFTDVMPVCAASTVIVKSKGSLSEPVDVSVKFVVTPEPIIFSSLALLIVTSVPSSSSI